jgi:sigma-E factor negative regulatory protein RseC
LNIANYDVIIKAVENTLLVMITVFTDFILWERSDEIMKTEEGTIISIDEVGLAEVKVGRHSDCIACGACPGAENIVVKATNPIHGKVGDRVTFEVRETNVVIGAFVCFIMPLLVAAIGVFVGRWVSTPLGYDIVQAEIIGGIVAFLIALVGVKMYDRFLSDKESSKPKIVSIL